MIQVMSLWRNDGDRRIHGRMNHLLSKTCRSMPVRWLWAVGDSTDDTEAILAEMAHEAENVTLIRADTGFEGNTPEIRRMRTSTTASEMFKHIHPDATHVCLHESDLVSPFDVLDLLLKNPLPCAGWPVINLHGTPQFYDIWAYRGMTGTCFGPVVQRPKGLIQVGSFGSLWVAPANLVRNRVMGPDAIVDLCAQWTKENVALYVDPSVTVEQPVTLWEE